MAPEDTFKVTGWSKRGRGLRTEPVAAHGMLQYQPQGRQGKLGGGDVGPDFAGEHGVWSLPPGQRATQGF